MIVAFELQIYTTAGEDRNIVNRILLTVVSFAMVDDGQQSLQILKTFVYLPTRIACYPSSCSFLSSW
jgi:hypothetical protein